MSRCLPMNFAIALRTPFSTEHFQATEKLSSSNVSALVSIWDRNCSSKAKNNRCYKLKIVHLQTSVLILYKKCTNYQHYVKCILSRSFLWSMFFRIWTEHGDRAIRESADQKNSISITFHAMQNTTVKYIVFL